MNRMMRLLFALALGLIPLCAIPCLAQNAGPQPRAYLGMNPFPLGLTSDDAIVRNGWFVSPKFPSIEFSTQRLFVAGARNRKEFDFTPFEFV